MEQNKVLMVIVSVVIFFAAIVGVGMALLYPRGDETAQASSGSVVREFDPIEYVRSPDNGDMEDSDGGDASDEVVIVYGDLPEPPAADGDSQDRTIVEERMEDGPAEVTITERPARTPRTADSDDGSASSGSTAEATEERDEDTEPEATASRDDSPAPPAEPESTPEPRQIRVTEYWIQLISSPNRDRVNQARTTLTDYSLGGRITTRDIEGELFYRLRVGPYDSHAEAEKFLEWIRDIDGFSEAYISEEYPLRTVRS